MILDATAINMAPIIDPVAAVDAVRRRVQRGHRHRRRRVPQARRQAARRHRQGPAAGRRVPRPPARRGRASQGRGRGSRHDRRATSSARPPRPTFAAPGGWAAGATGYRRWTVVDEAAGAVHTGFDVCVLDARRHGAGARALVRGERLRPRRASACSTPPRARSGSGRATTRCCRSAWRTRGATSATRTGAVGRDAGAGAAATGSTTTPSWCRRCRTGEPVPVDVRDPRTRRFGTITPGAHGRRRGRARNCSRSRRACAPPCSSTAGSR